MSEDTYNAERARTQILLTLHEYAHKTGAPAGHDVLRWFEDDHMRAISKSLKSPTAPVEPWSCGARKSGFPEPADCNWPLCGCDPYAEKVLTALEERGIGLKGAQDA